MRRSVAFLAMAVLAMTLSALPLLKSHEQQGRPMYFNNDGHLNLEGQAAIADFVGAQLREE